MIRTGRKDVRTRHRPREKGRGRFHGRVSTVCIYERAKLSSYPSLSLSFSISPSLFTPGTMCVWYRVCKRRLYLHIYIYIHTGICTVRTCIYIYIWFRLHPVVFCMSNDTQLCTYVWNPPTHAHTHTIRGGGTGRPERMVGKDDRWWREGEFFATSKAYEREKKKK